MATPLKYFSLVLLVIVGFGLAQHHFSNTQAPKLVPYIFAMKSGNYGLDEVVKVPDTEFLRKVSESNEKLLKLTTLLLAKIIPVEPAPDPKQIEKIPEDKIALEKFLLDLPAKTPWEQKMKTNRMNLLQANLEEFDMRDALAKGQAVTDEQRAGIAAHMREIMEEERTLLSEVSSKK